MALLHLLKDLSSEHKWKITVAHFNHQLRGRASDADEQLVRKTAAKLKLPLVAGRTDVKQFAARSKLSIEMAARKLRHEFFVNAARKKNIHTIALAHHADDQVELFFLRLLRGAGGEGLAGMKLRSPSPADKTISLVRPLLGIAKSELLEFARENKIRSRVDATNFSTDFLRNRIRNELLPLLRKKYQPALDKSILRLMEIVGTESEFVGEAARRFRRSRASPQFKYLPVAIQRRVLQSRLAEISVTADFELIESLRLTPNLFVSVGPGISAMRDKSGEVKLRTDLEREFNVDQLPVDLTDRRGFANFGGVKLRWVFQTDTALVGRASARAEHGDEKVQKGGSRGRSPHREEFFDADKIGGRILLRHWRPGDRFQPIGMKSAVKLQDLFTNSKISRERRMNLVLAEAANGEIFWVEDLRIGEAFKLTPETARVLVWRWSKLAV